MARCYPEVKKSLSNQLLIFKFNSGSVEYQAEGQNCDIFRTMDQANTYRLDDLTYFISPVILISFEKILELTPTREHFFVFL